MTKCVLPWYNRTGWLGVNKDLFTYLLTYLQVKDVASILLIFLVFLISFGLAYHANMFPRAPRHCSILANIIYLPYFQIYGDLDYLEQMKGLFRLWTNYMHWSYPIIMYNRKSTSLSFGYFG